jgi:hypothetical protein
MSFEQIFQGFVIFMLSSVDHFNPFFFCDTFDIVLHHCHISMTLFQLQKKHLTPRIVLGILS